MSTLQEGVPRLSDLGERQLVHALLRIFQSDADVGLGDDAAFLPMDDHFLLLTTDVINARTHIPEGATPEHVGWYSVAVNFSDIAAMGGEPLGFLASLSLPHDLDVSYLERMAKSMDGCARKYGAGVLGGDTKEGVELSVGGTAVGRTRRKRVLRRRGCREGDLVAVTGNLGRAGWALRELAREPSSEEGLDILMRVQPRIREGLILAAEDGVTCCMDISDGLAASLGQLSAVNPTSFVIEYESLPAAPEVQQLHDTERREALLFEGGDFELLFTLRPEAWDSLRSDLERDGCHATVIGTVESVGPNVLSIQGKRGALEARGYEHFK